jgi:hypothetical protein
MSIDPFAQLAKYDELRAAIESLAAEQSAELKPLVDAVRVLTACSVSHGLAAIPRVAEELRQFNLTAFTRDVATARATQLDSLPQPKPLAISAVWNLVASEAEGDAEKAESIRRSIESRPTVMIELDDALGEIAFDCINEMRKRLAPRYTVSLHQMLTRIGLTLDDLIEWSSGRVQTGMTYETKAALGKWLFYMRLPKSGGAGMEKKKQRIVEAMPEYSEYDSIPMTKRELAEVMQISPTTLYVKLKSKELSHQMHGKKVVLV